MSQTDDAEASRIIATLWQLRGVRPGQLASLSESGIRINMSFLHVPGSIKKEFLCHMSLLCTCSTTLLLHKSHETAMHYFLEYASKHTYIKCIHVTTSDIL